MVAATSRKLVSNIAPLVRTKLLPVGGTWGRLWSPDEDKILEELYEQVSVKKILSLNVLPGRSRPAIMTRGRFLGLKAAKGNRRWTPDEIQYLTSEWEFSTIAAIAKYLKRSQPSVIKRANELSLPIGPPEGAESLVGAAKRTGFSLPMFRKVMAFGEVEFFPCKTYPKSWKNKHRKKAWERNGRKTPERANCVRHYVWSEEVDQATEHWIKSAEVVGPAAERRGINKARLRIWLAEAGIKAPGKNRNWWISTVDIDNVVKAKLSLMEGKETITQASERFVMGWVALKTWLQDAGLKSIVSPMDENEYLFVTSEINQVFAERIKSNTRVVINGERPVTQRQIENVKRRVRFEKLKEDRSIIREQKRLASALSQKIKLEKAEAWALKLQRNRLLVTLRKLFRQKIREQRAQALTLRHEQRARKKAKRGKAIALKSTRVVERKVAAA